MSLRAVSRPKSKVLLLFNYFSNAQYKRMAGVGAQIGVFVTSTIVGGDWSASWPCRFTTGKDPQVPTFMKSGRALTT
jgi:hypothetical protein